jgi:hypothetical protein
LILGFSVAARAEFDPHEPSLYPTGVPTADTLRAHEWLFAPQGWMSYGVTPQDTATVDWLASLFGAPAGYYRHQFGDAAIDSPEFRTSLEVYALDCTTTVKVNRSHAFNQELKNTVEWAHMLHTLPLTESARFHFFYGLTYGDHIRYYSDRTLNFPDRVHEHYFNPDLGAAFEFRQNAFFKYTVYALYGNTFYFFDQIPQKYMIGGGLEFSPFAKERNGILSRLHFELDGYWAYLPDPHYTQFWPPLLPIVFWQWGG